MTSHFFFVTDGGSLATPPAIYFAPAARESGAITIPLPNLFNSNAEPVSEAPFSFTTDPFAITVADGTGGAWDFSSCSSGVPFRSTLATAYVDLLGQLEPFLNFGAPGPGNIFSMLQQIISTGMPLTFAETLFYRYSYMFLTGNGASWVDLVPGMRLRIESQAYQTINPSATTPLNGFVPSGTTYAELGTNALTGSAFLGFNPFLSTAMPDVAPNTVVFSTAAIGGAVDIIGQSAYRLAYWRLCFPPFALASAGSQGWAGTQQNATLIGAATRADLETATASFIANGVLSSGAAVYFDGRTIITPEIAVILAGQRVWVPLGTTLRNVLESLTPIPYFGAAGIEVDAVRPAPLSRALAPDVTKWTGPSTAAFELTRGSGGYQYYTKWLMDSFDVPLQSGDVIGLALPS